MIEISAVTIGAILLKIMWLSITAGILGVFFLWPIGDKPTASEAKVAFVVVFAIVAAFILELIKI